MSSTGFRPWTAALVFIFGLAQATPGLAQGPGDDWDIVRDRRGRAEMAHLQFSNGLAIMVQCKDRSLDVVLGGLPPPGLAIQGGLYPQRPIRLTLRGEDEKVQFWFVGSDETTAVSPLPAPFARSLREGGSLHIGVLKDGTDGPVLNYQVELPSSSSNLDEVLTTCRKPVEDPRDALLNGIDVEGPLEWTERPYAPMDDVTPVSGLAVISCATRPDGRLHDCEVESEHPRGTTAADYGRDLARRWRVQMQGAPDAPVPLTRVYFSVSIEFD